MLLTILAVHRTTWMNLFLGVDDPTAPGTTHNVSYASCQMWNLPKWFSLERR